MKRSLHAASTPDGKGHVSTQPGSPLPAEPPKPLVLTVEAGRLPASVIDDLKRLCEDYPGECEVVLEVHTSAGPRRLKFGQGYRVAARNASLKAELDRLLGPSRPLELASA